MDRLVRIALRIITALIIVATVVSFSESYHGLFEWAVSHQVPWFWALIWPLMLDLVILVGECTVFVAIHRHWKVTHRVWAWAVTYTGLAVSTLANGGHVTSRDWLTHITNAMPPVALMFALTVGLGVLKRTRMQPSVPLPHTLTERPVHTRSERLSQPLTEMVRTGRTETLSQPLTSLSHLLRALSVRRLHRSSRRPWSPLRPSLEGTSGPPRRASPCPAIAARD